jgi:hypothetical protein
MERSAPPAAQLETKMHPVTLRFAPDLEREFRVEYHQHTLPIVRLALVLGILLYSLFGILDALIAIVRRALARSPAARPSAAELARLLRGETEATLPSFPDSAKGLSAGRNR